MYQIKKQSNESTQTTQVNLIYDQLNKKCQFRRKFQIQIINSSQTIEVEEYKNQIADMINEIYEPLTIVIQKQIQSINQTNNLFIHSSFKLRFNQDEITKEKIINPIKALQSDKLIFDPLICNLSTFVEKIDSINEPLQNQINEIDVDEYYVILILWNLFKKLKEKGQFEIILYPKKCNFGICKIFGKQEQIYFDSESHYQNFLIQNSKFSKQSNRIYQALKNKQIIELRLDLFQINSVDNFKKKQRLIQKSRRHNKQINKKVDQIYINDLEEQKGIKNQENFWISIDNCVKPYSTLCLTGDIKDYQNHILTNDYKSTPICKCGQQFNPYNCDTLVIDLDLKEAIDHLIEELIADSNLDYVIYLIPLYLEVEIDLYENQFIVLFFRDKDDNKVNLKKLLFKARNYNYDIDKINDRVAVEQNLFEGIDVFDDELDDAFNFENLNKNENIKSLKEEQNFQGEYANIKKSTKEIQNEFGLSMSYKHLQIYLLIQSMLNNIGYLAYISTMSLFLLITPSSFIKKLDQEQEQSLFNTQLSGLLQTESGLRLCGLYHLILLAAQILKQEQLKFICLNVYALFLISTIGSLFFDGVGQQQSERLERFGYQAGIFSFIAYNNWPQEKDQKESKKVVEEKSEAQIKQKTDEPKEKEKSDENKQKEQNQNKKKGKAKKE